MHFLCLQRAQKLKLPSEVVKIPCVQLGTKIIPLRFFLLFVIQPLKQIQKRKNKHTVSDMSTDSCQGSSRKWLHWTVWKCFTDQQGFIQAIIYMSNVFAVTKGVFCIHHKKRHSSHIDSIISGHIYTAFAFYFVQKVQYSAYFWSSFSYVILYMYSYIGSRFHLVPIQYC